MEHKTQYILCGYRLGLQYNRGIILYSARGAPQGHTPASGGSQYLSGGRLVLTSSCGMKHDFGIVYYYMSCVLTPVNICT